MITKRCLVAGSVVLKAGRVLLILGAAVLVAGSIATSLARPAPKSVSVEAIFPPEGDRGSALTDSGTLDPVVLDDASAPFAVSAADAPAANGVTVSQALVWNDKTGAWAEPEAINAASAGYSQGTAVPVLIRISQAVAGVRYRVTIDYSDCGFGYSAAFDSFADTAAGGDAPRTTQPAPGRSQPDASTTVPAGHAGTEGAGILAWGATFSAPPSGARASATCDEDAIVVLDLLAQTDKVSLIFAGRLRAENTTPSVSPSFAPLPVLVERAP